MGSYSESGTNADLTVYNRNVDLLRIQGLLDLPFEFQQGFVWSRLSPHLGVAGRFQLGGHNVNSQLLGQSLRFDPGNPTNLFEFVLGIQGECECCGYSLFFDLDGTFDSGQSRRILGQVGIKAIF